MGREEELRALAKGCAYYKEKYEKLSEEKIKLESEVHQLRTKGYLVKTETTADIVNSKEFREIQAKTKEYVAMSEKEKEQLSQESNVLLRSMTKLSTELSQTVEANSALMSENNALKEKINAMLNDRMKEQTDSFGELLKNKDLTHESKLALEKSNILVKELKDEIDSQKVKIAELEKYRGMYEKEARRVSQLEDEVDVLRRSAKASTSTLVDDDNDDLSVCDL